MRFITRLKRRGVKGSAPPFLGRGAAKMQSVRRPGVDFEPAAQTCGSRSDEVSDPKMHNSASTAPTIANVDTTTSWRGYTDSPRRWPDDWKTVSQNLIENCARHVSDLLSMTACREMKETTDSAVLLSISL